MTETNNKLKHLCLGTALWGWEGAEVDCFGVLDEFYKNGHRYIDTATIYPIDKKPQSCGRSLELVGEWSKANGVDDLKVIVKLGGVNNLGSNENDLSFEFLKYENEKISSLLGENYYCSMIHWDNETKPELIEQYCHHFKQANRASRLGLSGIKDWKGYFEYLSDDLYLEVKNNILFDGVSTIPLRDKQDRVFVYGTSVSGLKLDRKDYKTGSYVGLARGAEFHDEQIKKLNIENILNYLDRSQAVENFYHLGMILNQSDDRVFGIIIAPRTNEQLRDIFEFRDSLVNHLIKEYRLFSKSYKYFLN